jgi:four helix bundle protein
MPTPFDHEKLRAYQDAVRFVTWMGPLIERLPAKLAARDQLDRASTSIVLNLAEGNGKRSHPDRCRYFDIARGSVLECAACLDVLVARKHIDAAEAAAGKDLLVGLVSMIAGLIARFSNDVHEEEQSPYGIPLQVGLGENEKDNEKEND